MTRKDKDSDKFQARGSVSKPKSPGSVSSAQCLAVVCEEAHKKLLAMSASDRRAHVLEHRLCLNYLRAGHRASQCRVRAMCSKCPKKHHGLLHDIQLRAGTPATKSDVGSTAVSPVTDGQTNIKSYGCKAETNSTVHLMTAVGEVHGQQLRAKIRGFH